MTELSIYINREDASKAEKDELNNFIYYILEAMDLEELDEIWGEELTVENKLKLRKYLQKYDIEIIHDGDRGYNIYVGDDLVGEWKKPRFVLREDPKARTINKRYYFEMIISFWSPFGGENDNNEEKDSGSENR